VGLNSATSVNATSIRGLYRSLNVLSGIGFYWFSGSNFAAVGKIRIYGYKNT
jgi:hypothetical protein